MGARADIDHRVAVLADGQDGVVRRTQLVGLGLSARAITGRVGRGWLRPLYKGV